MDNPAVKGMYAVGADHAVLLMDYAIVDIRANHAVMGINAMKVRAVLVMGSAIQNK